MCKIRFRKVFVMRKLLAIILAVIMVVPLGVVAFAAADTNISFAVYTGNSTKNYNPNRQVNVVVSLRNINFGTNDGVSAFELDVYYDKNKVEPVFTPAEDGDGDAFDLSKLVDKCPDGWEKVGSLYTNEAYYSISVGDIEGAGTTSADDELVIKIPFKVKANCRVQDISFSFDNVKAYNSDMSSFAEIKVDNVVMRYAVQPSPGEPTVPRDSISLDVAGYRHDINNVFFYAKKKMTVGEYVKTFCDNSYKQDRMSNFAILIAGSDGIITYVDTKVGSTSDKSSVVIPAGSYIIGVHSSNSADFTKFKEIAEVGQQVTVYNINIEGAGRTDEATDLLKAAFEISDPDEGNPPVVGGEPVDPDGGYEDDTPTPGDVLIGDVNLNGKIDARDYLLLKRAFFGTYTLTCDLEVADINGNGKIDARDYLLLKRAFFGTYTIQG